MCVVGQLGVPGSDRRYIYSYLVIWYVEVTLRQSGERLPESRCYLENKSPLCQWSSKHLEDNWHSGLLSSTQEIQQRRANVDF